MNKSASKSRKSTKPATATEPGQPVVHSPEPYQSLMRRTDWFLSDIECLRELFREVLPILQQRDEQRTAEYKRLLDGIVIQIKRKPKGKDVASLISQLQSLKTVAPKLQAARRLFTSNVLLTLVSRFEQLEHDMLLSIFRVYPDRLKGSGEGLGYEDVVAAGTLEELRTKLITRQVDQICGTSYLDLAKYFGDLLRDKIQDWDLWPIIVETYERRHVHAHSGGLATAKYLRICSAHKATATDGVSAGSRLEVDDEYFQERVAAFYELAVRLSQTLCRKQFPSQLGYAESKLQEIGYGLLRAQEWQLAKSIFGFAVSLPSELTPGDEARRVSIINYCIALKELGDSAAVKKQLGSVDWSASASQFSLAVAVLNEDYRAAEKLMRPMRKDDPIVELHYREWPLFRTFRETPYFRRAFKRIYRRDFERLTQQAVTIQLSAQEPMQTMRQST